MLAITILDHDLDRMRGCEESVNEALKELGIKSVVTGVSEPPYLSRLNVWDRLPALEIKGRVWSRKSENAFTKGEVIALLRKHYLGNAAQERPAPADSSKNQ